MVFSSCHVNSGYWQCPCFLFSLLWLTYWNGLMQLLWSNIIIKRLNQINSTWLGCLTHLCKFSDIKIQVICYNPDLDSEINEAFSFHSFPSWNIYRNLVFSSVKNKVAYIASCYFIHLHVQPKWMHRESHFTCITWQVAKEGDLGK